MCCHLASRRSLQQRVLANTVELLHHPAPQRIQPRQLLLAFASALRQLLRVLARTLALRRAISTCICHVHIIVSCLVLCLFPRFSSLSFFACLTAETNLTSDEQTNKPTLSAAL